MAANFILKSKTHLKADSVLYLSNVHIAAGTCKPSNAVIRVWNEVKGKKYDEWEGATI